MTTGHNEGELCYYCGKPVNVLSCNPSDWPLTLCHPDEPGVVKYHHTGCVSERLETAEDQMMARARCLKAVDDEPELPEDMPLDLRQDIILCFHLEDWGRIEEMFRATVRCTKKNIRKRIEESHEK